MGVYSWIPTTLLWFLTLCAADSVVLFPEQCTIPLQEGDCDSVMPRWYFNPEIGLCKRFYFKGCNGNENNFLSLEDCENTCRPIQEDTVPDSDGYENSEMGEIVEESSDGNRELQREAYIENDNGNGEGNSQDFVNKDFQRENQEYDQDILNQENQREEGFLAENENEPVLMEETVPELSNYDANKEEIVEDLGNNEDEAVLLEESAPESDNYEEVGNRDGKKVEISDGMKEMVQQIAKVEEKELQREDSLMTDTFTNLDQISADLNIKKPVEVDDTMSPIKIADVQYSLDRNTQEEEESSGEGETPFWNEGDLDANLKSGASLQPVLEQEEPVKVKAFIKPERCGIKMEEGLCKARMLRWYFKKELNMCLPFVYGGCGGNKNRFTTLEECSSVCQGKMTKEDSANSYKALKKPSIILTIRAGKKLAKMSPWLQQKYGPRVHKIVKHLERHVDNTRSRFLPRNIPRRFSLPMFVSRNPNTVPENTERRPSGLIHERMERRPTPNLVLPTTTPPVYSKAKYDVTTGQNENVYDTDTMGERNVENNNVRPPIQNVMENEEQKEPQFLPGRRRIVSAFTTPLVNRLPFFKIFFGKVIRYGTGGPNEEEIQAYDKDDVTNGNGQPLKEDAPQLENEQENGLPYSENEIGQSEMDGGDYGSSVTDNEVEQRFREKEDDKLREMEEDENVNGPEKESESLIEAEPQNQEIASNEIEVNQPPMYSSSMDRGRNEMVRKQENRVNEEERSFHDRGRGFMRQDNSFYDNHPPMTYDWHSAKYGRRDMFGSKYGYRKGSKRDGIKLVQVFVNKFGSHGPPAPPGGAHYHGSGVHYHGPGPMSYHGHGPMSYGNGPMSYHGPPSYGPQGYYNHMKERDQNIRYLARPLQYNKQPYMAVVQPKQEMLLGKEGEGEGEDMTSNSCQMPATRGPCFNFEMKWYYNKEKNICDLFAFSGCGGNGNRFNSAEECYMTCIFRQEEIAPAEDVTQVPDNSIEVTYDPDDITKDPIFVSVDKVITDEYDVDEPDRLETLQTTEDIDTTPADDQPQTTSTTTTTTTTTTGSKTDIIAKQMKNNEMQKEKEKKPESEEKTNKISQAIIPDFLETSVRKLHDHGHVQYATTMFVLCGVAVALLVLVIVSTVAHQETQSQERNGNRESRETLLDYGSYTNHPPRPAQDFVFFSNFCASTQSHSSRAVITQ